MISDNKNKKKEMDNGKNEKLVCGVRVSSVCPGKVSGNNMIYEPSNIDLAMKLHYIKIIYFFDEKAAEGITLRTVKERTFTWLNYYYESCGRFRRDETGRPYIKCNDCGLRFVEAMSSKTMQEWLLLDTTNNTNNDNIKLLVPQQHFIGPQLTFSPPIFIQITFFKCGGISLAISWGHVLGDAFSVSNYMNSLGQFICSHEPDYPPPLKKSPPNFPKPIKEVSSSPLSIKDVGPVGDLWINPTSFEMDTFYFHVTQAQLAQVRIKLSGTEQSMAQIEPFEALCAIIWKAIAKIKVGAKPNVVTVVKKGVNGPNEDDWDLRNNQIISSVTADFSVEEAHPEDLACLIRDWAQDERAQIGELVDRDPGASDFIVYGSKLTFVDFEDANFYGFELQGSNPTFVHCYIDGLGEEGVVLVLPAPKNGYGAIDNAKAEGEGRIVTLMLPKNCMEEIKEELRKEWDLIA